MNDECIHQLKIHKMHFNYVTSMLIVVEHQPFTCAMVAKNIFAHWLTCHNMYWKCEHVQNITILGDYDIIFVHNITYQLEMPTLVVSHRIIIHHENINMTCLYNYHKIINEKSLPWTNLIKELIVSYNGNKQNKIMWRS